MSEESTRQNKLKAVYKKISYQVEKTPESKLMLAVIAQALGDLSSKRESAKTYFLGDMLHAQAIGLDPDWIRSLLKKINVLP